MFLITDYEGVGLTSRDANSKRAAKEATTIFQDYYPEFLVSAKHHQPGLKSTYRPRKAKKFFINVPSFFTWIFWYDSQASLLRYLILTGLPQAIQTARLCADTREDERSRHGFVRNQQGASAYHR